MITYCLLLTHTLNEVAAATVVVVVIMTTTTIIIIIISVLCHYCAASTAKSSVTDTAQNYNDKNNKYNQITIIEL
jgi:hypothetical protein